jgi:hypothetical protein
MPNFRCGGDVWITNDAEMTAFAAQRSTRMQLGHREPANYRGLDHHHPPRAHHRRGQLVRLLQHHPDYLQPARTHHDRRGHIGHEQPRPG